MHKVAVVLVTFNRKDLLKKCLEALFYQDRIPDAIFIINNASTDGTEEMLVENSFISGRVYQDDIDFESIFENVKIIYCRKRINDGGAGGFSFGLRLAFNYGYDWFWIMDDDGIPDQFCLENLLKVAKSYNIDYVAPTLITFDGKNHFENYFKNSPLDVINFEGGPFNGILLSRIIVEKVGVPIKEFFIWGDEYEYINRIRENGFFLATVKNAIHYHKSTKYSYRNVPRVFYLSRNLIFQIRLSKGVYLPKKYTTIFNYYVIFRILIGGIGSFNFKQVKECIKGVIEGYQKDVKKFQDAASIV